MAEVNRGKSPPGTETVREKNRRAAEAGIAKKKAYEGGKLFPPGPKDGRDEPAPESLPSKVEIPKRDSERFW